MSDTPTPPQGPNGSAPMMRQIAQYLKDLSFESPGAPQSLQGDLPTPAFEVGVDVAARKVADDQFEVELACNVSAARDGTTIFVVESNFAGLFLIQNIPADQMEPALLVEAPRMLFPFARQIIDSAVRDGGFSMPLLEPLDFASIYRMQMQQRQQAAQNQPDGPPDVGTA